MTIAYCVPAVTAKGAAKVPVKNPLPLKPGIVAVARSAPVGSPPDVARMESVRSGVVPVQRRAELAGEGDARTDPAGWWIEDAATAEPEAEWPD